MQRLLLFTAHYLMLPSSKTLRWLLLATLPCMANQCGDDESPYDCVRQYVGALSLRPASPQWLPTPDSLRFVNSNGFRVVLDRLPSIPPADSVLLPAEVSKFSAYRAQNPDNGYEADVTCGYYFRAAQVAAQYQGRSLHMHLQLNLLKNIEAGPQPAVYGTPLTVAAADTLPDILALTFNRQYTALLWLPTRLQPRPVMQGAATYLDSVQLAGRTLRAVYRVAVSVSSSSVQPQHFFFRPGEGLVGFTYTNNEQWVRF